MSELSRLRWRCRRGAKELDVVFTRYLEREYPSADAAHQAAFEFLLDTEDPIVMELITGRTPARSDDEAIVLNAMRGE